MLQAWFALKVTASSLFGLLMLFGLSNVVRHASQIWQNAIIIVYYFYSAVLISFSVYQIWLTDDKDQVLFDLEY